jgi:GT2 family glycosyltransferase
LSPELSVVICTYNRHHDLEECLSSIFDLKVVPSEVIVVDSDSEDDTKELKESFPIKFLSITQRNRELARNIGISKARGEIVAFLDDDVVICKEWMDSILEPYTDDGVGGVGGRVVPYGKAEEFHVKTSRHSVGRVFNDGLVIGNFDLPLENPIEVDSLIGCNMSFRRELLLETGGFDENYVGTSYRDDTDLCVRVRQLRYKLVYAPKALVWHKFKGKSLGSEWLYWYVRNHVYFYFKNLFPLNNGSLPMFLYHMFMPPRDYVLKSGIKVKLTSKSVPSVLKGLVNGYSLWRKNA